MESLNNLFSHTISVPQELGFEPSLLTLYPTSLLTRLNCLSPACGVISIVNEFWNLVIDMELWNLVINNHMRV